MLLESMNMKFGQCAARMVCPVAQCLGPQPKKIQGLGSLLSGAASHLRGACNHTSGTRCWLLAGTSAELSTRTPPHGFSMWSLCTG